MRNKRKLRYVNILLMLLSIALFIALGAFLVWNRREESKRIEQLQMEQQESSGSRQPEQMQMATPTPTPEVTATPTPEATVSGISLRGDAFVEEAQQESKGYAAQLQKLLEGEEDCMVWDYTMSEAGSMSQLRLAGVPQEELTTYVEKHKEAARGNSLRITETKIRELSEEELVREDQKGIPVICIGYYGGWNNDLEELCQQQQRLLDTYEQQEKYIIMGVYPSVYSDREAYDQKMNEQWGEHYLPVQKEINSPILSENGQKEIAQAVYDKLNDLGYFV